MCIYLDPATQNPTDYMHQTFEGVFRHDAGQMFNSAKLPFYLGAPKSVKALDEVLLQVKWPHEFQRSCLPLAQLAQYKASELKNLLFYAIVPSNS